MATEQPNILWILTDQHNARTMSCAGEPLLRTPNMDRLAHEGVRFSRAYGNSAHCGPSRISYMTGMYEHFHRRHSNTDEPPDHLNPITSTLKRVGYQTAIIGKGHIGVHWSRREYDYHRFDHMTDALPDDPLSCDYFRSLVEAEVADDFDLNKKWTKHPECAVTSPLPLAHSVEVWCGNESVKYLRDRDKGKPFFACISFSRPHDPLTVPVPFDRMYDPEEVTVPANAADEFEGKSERQQQAKRGELPYPFRPRDRAHLQKCIAHYYGLVSLIDEQIGRILEELESQDILEETIVIYSADHGDFAGEHGLIWKNLGFYECIHRVPFILRYPAALPQGEVFDSFVESVDLYPTLTDLLGIEAPNTVQGRSLIPALQGRDTWNKQAVLCEHVKTYHHMSMRTEEFRITLDITGDESELYDHRVDPGELINRWDDPDYRDIREKLLIDLLRFRSCPPLLHGSLPEGLTPANVPGYETETWSQAHEDIHSGVPWSEVVARGDG